MLSALGFDLVDVGWSSNVDGRLSVGRREPEVADETDDDDDEGDEVEPVRRVA